jgi:two-component system response regulator ResD
MALEGHFDIVVLDVMLPEKSGIEIASALREAGCDTPILFLTALGKESDVLRGFGVGADDYMVKPFSPRELVVRISAILRRQQAGPPRSDSTIEFGSLSLSRLRATQLLCRWRSTGTDPL